MNELELILAAARERELTVDQIENLEILLFIAFNVVFVPFCIWGIKWLFRNVLNLNVEKVSTSRALLKVLICSFISVLLLRYSVGLYLTYLMNPESAIWWEDFSNSVIHTLQTFSMDEDYTAYLDVGKIMAEQMWGAESSDTYLYVVFVSVMNVVAPVAGGAMLFEILTSIFPNVMLFIAYRCYFNKKYYFSKLNERSLTLAESIVKAYRDDRIRSLNVFKRPIIIFCDVYTDKENEKESELLAGAGAIGAICVRDDLIHIRKNKFRNRVFVLMDDDNNEINNLKMLANLADGRNAHKLKHSEVFLFSQSDMHTVVEAQVTRRLKEEYGFKDSELPVITPVKCYKNLVNNLLADIPLYESLVEDKLSGKKLCLNVSILGGGITGKEMMMAVYWFGQILDCELVINVFSKETKDEFYDNLDYINPEIDLSTREKHRILSVDGTEENCNPPYCTINYTQSQIDTASFFESEGIGEKCLNSDYIFVALGSDEANIEVANKLKTEVGRYHMKETCPTKTVITYVVYNSGLCETLNEETCFDFSLADDKPDIYMKAVGSLKSVYGIENVFCANYSRWAENTGDLYSVVANSKGRRDLADKNRYDIYNVWSDRARAMHVKYKIFSAGLITTSVFDTGTTQSREYNEALAQAYCKYAELATSGADGNDLKMLQRLAWLEHRRWMAFMRTMGFKSTERYAEYMRKYYNMDKENALEEQGILLKLIYAWVCRMADGRDKDSEDENAKPSVTSRLKAYLEGILYKEPFVEHKHIALKLHPCIVECTPFSKDITPEAVKLVSDKTDVESLNRFFSQLWEKNAHRGVDLLDNVTLELNKVKAELKGDESSGITDYKQYDYPCHDIDEKSLERMKKILKKRDSRLKRQDLVKKAVQRCLGNKSTGE